MKIPKQLNFLGHKIVIKQVNKLSIEKYDSGFYDWKAGKIEIEKKLSPTVKEEVLFHEICEALAHYMQMNYHETTNHDGFSRYHSLLWGILKDNKLIN